MTDQFSRSEMIFGREAMQKLKNSRIAVFGIGGVGSSAAEALVRGGIGAVDLFDNDIISVTNLNRQIIALHSTIGQYKADAAKSRFLDINPDCRITAHKIFYSAKNSSEFDFSVYDYIIDAIDTVSSKIEIIINAKKCGVPVISSMGTGNKTDPSSFEADDIYKTSVCPLARVMRCELRKRGIKSLRVVYSKEKPSAPGTAADDTPQGRHVPGSASFAPPAAGFIIAGEAIKDLTGTKSLF